ncbi:MAG: DUF106 domain-containing protein [Candidatus Aenigmarchaeota archaeon]|nr:DUF106 domain-containing protein [Candidatus Aenigmarchaeota archaeon]
MLPIQEVLIWSLGLSLLLAVLYRFLTNPREIKLLKEEIKGYRERSNKAQKAGNAEEANKLLSEMMKLTSKQMRSNMKPMIASLVIFFIAIGFLRETYSNFIIQLPFILPLLSYSFPFIILRDSIGWFWWYILITLPATFIFRKLLGVE